MCVPQRWLSLSFIVVVFFAELRVQRNPYGPRLAVVTREDSCFCVYWFELCAIIVQHKWAPEARWGMSGPKERRSGTVDGVGSTLSGLDCWGQREAANDSTVAGSRS